MTTRVKRVMRRTRIVLAAAALLLSGAAFLGGGVLAARWLAVQFAPSLMRWCAAYSVGAAATVGAILLATLLFGRFYCAVICPFGILQDVIGFLSRRKGVSVPDLALLRYAVAGGVFGLFACGWTTGFLLLDPYSNFGRVLGPVSWGGMSALAAIVLLAVWKKRLFCVSLCPVGTLLGLPAKVGLFRLAIGDRCVRCGKCVKNCPAGCIDLPNRRIDNERCVRCLNCVALCPRDTVGFVRAWRRKPLDFAPARRAFLRRAAALASGLAAGAVLARTGLERLGKGLGRRTGILPPGAGDEAHFAAKCTGCQLCTRNCPAHIIVPASGGDGPVQLDLARGSCRFDCRNCSQVCPTGAIKPLTLRDKQRLRIAEARFNPQTCIVFQNDEPCGRCAAACPTGAIRLRKNGTPRPVNRKLCIGCGACQAVCPAPAKAMTVHAVERQTPMEG